MSSYSELKKRLQNSGIKKEDEEEKKEDGGVKSSYQKLKEKLGNSGMSFANVGVDETYISSFFTDASKFFNTAESDYGKVGWGNASSYYDTRLRTYEDLNSRYNYVRAYINANKGSLSNKQYSDYSSFLDNYEKGSSDILKSFEDAKNYYGKFKTEEDYNKAYKEQLAYQEKLEGYKNFDLEAGKLEIEELEAQSNTKKKDKKAIESQISSLKAQQSQAYSVRDVGKAEELGKQIAELQKQLEPYNTFEADLAEKRAYYREAERYQTSSKLYDGAVNAGDFEEYAQKGADIKNPTSLSEAEGWFSVGNWRPFGEDIGNIVTFSREFAEEEWSTVDSNASLGNLLTNILYTFMTDDEVKVYNYYLGKGDTASADAYLNSLNSTLTARQAGQMEDAISGNGFLEAVFGFNAGLDQFATGIQNLFSDKEYYDPTAIQIASQQIRENLDTNIGKVFYDLTNTTGNMLPSILVSYIPVVGQVAGAATMGLSASGNAKAEMINAGYTKDQANAYAAMVGISESVLQYALGGISKLGGKYSLSTNALKAIDGVDNALGRFALKYGTSMFSEGFEEGLQSVLEPIFKSIVTGDKMEGIDWGEVGYSALLGALSAGFLEGGSIIANDVSTTKAGKAVQKAGAVDRLTNLAKDTTIFSADSVAYKIANKVNENTGAYQIGRLLQEAGATLSEQNMADIVAGLEARNIPTKYAKKLAKQYKAFLDGEMNFTDEQIKVLEELTPLGSAIREKLIEQNLTSYQMLQEGVIGRDTDVYKRTREYTDIMKLAEEVAQGKTPSKTAPKEANSVAPLSEAEVARRIENAENAFNSANSSVHPRKSIGTIETSQKTAKESQFSHSIDGKTVLVNTGEEVSIQKIDSIKDGVVSVRLKNGNVVDAKEVSFGSKDEALMYEVVTNMDVDTANTMIAGFDPSEGISAYDYAKGFEEAYTYGVKGFHQSEMYKDGFSANLSEAKKNWAYKLGQEAGQKDVKAKQEQVDKAKAGAENAQAAKNKGKVIYLDKNIKPRNAKQKTAIKAVEVLSEAMGNNWYIFESYVDKSGRRVYKDIDGKIKLAPNGKYDTKTGDVYVDLNAGQNGEGVMIFTMAHELTHFIRQWSPAKFKVFADFLLAQYGAKGISVNELVQRKIAKAEANGRSIDFDEAYEEVVADSCEAMLRDSNAMEAIAKLKAKDESIWGRIKNFISNLVMKIRVAYAKLNPDSLEANYVLKMKDAAEQLQTLWTEALVDAGESYSEIRNVLGEGSTIEVNENGDFLLGRSQNGNILYNERTWQEGGRQALETALKSEGYSKDDINAALTIMDAKHDLVVQLGKEFSEQGNINKAILTTDLKTGRSALSALVKNGDYPVNIDLLTVCKKRQAYQRVITRLCETGLIERATLDSLAIAEINKILGENGYETACLGCFVESKRLRIQEYAQTVCDEWNAIVDKKVGKGKAKSFDFAKDSFLSNITDKEVDKLISEYEAVGKVNVGVGSYVKKFEKLMDTIPTLRKHLSISDIATPQGMANMKATSTEMFNLIASRYGSGTPKPVQDFNPYNHELAVYGTVPQKYSSLREYLYAIGGARMQSFSDFIVENWFDYCQIVADLATRKLPMHTYTKEISLAKLFGMTGIKINMSLIPDVDKSLGKEYAGLTRNADGELELIWGDKDRFKATGGKSYMQSINFADAIALQNDPRYSKNIGTIAIGISDNHIRMMLDDSRIRMIIPYHSSAINPIFANLMGVDFYNDYTNSQSTGVKYLVDSKGNIHTDIKLSKTQKGNLTSGFEFNENLQELGDARATAQAYLDWCADSSQHTIKIDGETYNAVLTPKFEQFSDHKNYYKLLEDFNTYDSITEQSAPQGDVQQVYPEDFETVLRDELTAREKYRQKQDPKWESTMGRIEAYLKKHTKADTVAYAKEQGIKLSTRDSAGNELTKEQQEYFKDSKVRDKNGNLMVVYHGSGAEFNEFLHSHIGQTGSAEGRGFYFTDNADFAKGYQRNGVALKQGYLNITKPLSDSKKTLKRAEIKKLLQEVDPTGDDVILNYDKEMGMGYPSRAWYNRALNDTVNAVMEYSDSDSDMLAEIANSGAGNKKVLTTIRSLFGYDGYIVEDKYPNTKVYVAFESNQFKNADNKTPTENPDIRYSERVTDKETLDFLENQEHVTVYRAMQLIDGKLYPPMNAYTYDENGKKVLMTPSELGAWEQSVERPDLIDKKTGKFKLDKGKVDGGKRGTTVPAAYNPYIHTSLSMLNDQFTSAYTRSNLVVVKGVVPKSELTSGYKAQYAKDSVGETEWHSGVVSTQLPESRKVILSRWFKPVEVMDNDVVAQNIKEMLGNTGIEIPYNVVSPKLRRSLEKIGVPIGEGRGIRNLPKKNEVKYSTRDLAPTFYSQMGKVVDGMKQEKFAANSVVSMLRGRGVKAEEIRWSGIATWLEGKKSVTKQELQEFIAGSQLQIGEQMSGTSTFVADNDNIYESEKAFKDAAYAIADEKGIARDQVRFNINTDIDYAYAFVLNTNEALLTADIEESGASPKWSQYKLDGGENYREIVFTMPNSSYSNRAMRGHWGQDAEGVLVHARIQDFDVNGKKMLFIEEIQSDWHNEGHEKGYTNKEYEDAVDSHDKLYNEYKKLDLAFHKYVRSNEFMTDPEDVRKKKHDWLRRKVDTAQKKYLDAEKVVNSLKEKGAGDTPNAPFRDNYHEYVLKRLLRMAAEQGYDSIGWTPAYIQSKRWSEDYAEAYRIEYDQDIPKFLKKYGRQWNAKVEKSKAPNGEEIWSMDITDSMKDSVLHEGQVLYSLRESTNGMANEALTPYNDELKGFIERDGNYIVDSFEKLEQIVDLAFDNPQLQATAYFGIVNVDALEKIKNSIPNLPKASKEILFKKGRDYSIAVTFDSIRHMVDDKQALTREDVIDYLDRLADTIIDFDSVIFSLYKKSERGLLFKKEFSDGTLATYNLISNRSRSLVLQSLYMDSGDYIKKKSAETLMLQNATPPTPKARVGQTSDNTISQDSEVVKQKTENSQKNSLRDSDGLSNRSLLANALDTATQNDIERNKLKLYKEKIGLIESEEQKLHEINEELKGLYFAKGSKDMARIRKLQFDKQQAENRINTYDRQLLSLEASKPLKDVLEREKKLAYKRAEQRGKEALAEYREKQAKRTNDIVKHYQEARKKAVQKVRETREKADQRDKLQKLVLETAKWISYPAKDDVKCPDILRKPYADFLKSIDLSSNRSLKGGDPTQNDLRIIAAMNSLATAIEQVRVAQDPNITTDNILDLGYLDLPADFVVKLREMAENAKDLMVEGDYVVNQMTSQEIKDLNRLIRTLNHAIKEMSTLYNNLRFANVEGLGADSITFLDSMGKAKSTSGLKDFVSWDNALPYYAFKRFGTAGESIFEELMDAQDNLAFNAQRIFDFKEKNWTDKEANEWGKDTHTITLTDGKSVVLTSSQAMGIYCLSRRGQAVPHLLGGGIRVIGVTKGLKKAQDSHTTLSQADIDIIVKSLTERQVKVAEAIQDFMSTVCADWGNEISMKRFLTNEFTEPFYYPIESNDENLPQKDPQAQQSDLYRLLNISATKPTIKGANNEVIIRNIFDVFTNHASDMARLNAFGMPLLDYMKWLNYREKILNADGVSFEVRGVRKSMNDAYGDKARSYVVNLIKDINGRSSDGGDHAWLMKMTRMAKTASVGFNMRVTLLQATSYPRAGMVLSAGSLAKGLTKVPNIKKAKKYCGIALWKSFGFYDTNIARSIEDQIKGTTNIRQKLIELSLKGAEWADAITWGALWNACEYEVAKTTKNKVGSEAFYQEVGKKLREVVYATQVVDSTLTRTQIMRNKSGLTQTATAFMSEPSLTANILMSAGFEFSKEKRITGSAKTAWKKTGKYIGRTIGIYSSVAILTAVMESLADAYRDDDDEEFIEKFGEAFKENAISNIIPFNKIPIISDIVDFVMSQFGIGFYSSDRLDTTALTQANNALKAWGEIIAEKKGEKETSKTLYNAIYNTVRALSSLTGIAFNGAMREVVTLWNNTAGESDPTLKIKTYESTDKELRKLLYDAIVAGDDKVTDSVKSQFGFKTEKEYESAIKTALREHDSRVKEAAQAYYEGDLRTYKTILQDIVGEGNFAEELVEDAIRAESSAIKRKEEEKNGGNTTEEPEKDEANSIYNASDINTAFESGDSALAKEIIEDLIKMKVANGKTDKEARSSLRSSMTSYWKPLYKQAYKDKDNVELARIRKILRDSGLYGGVDDVIETARDWLKD